MIYTIGFVTRQQLRDLQLEKILNSDFDENTYVHTGDFDFLGRVGTNIVDIYNHSDRYYRSRAIDQCSKYKTIKGAQSAIERFKSPTNKFRTSVRAKNDIWRTNEYVPIICDISEKWTAHINEKIAAETRLYENKVKLLKSKL
jgi:hypothetical protein